MNTKQNSVPENRVRTGSALELLVIGALGIVIAMIAARYDILERIVAFSRAHEKWEIDEILTVSVFLAVALAIHSARQWRRVRQSEQVLRQKTEDLQKAFSEIKQLRGIIPMCASCKSIRDDDGYWHRVEVYLRGHTEAQFSHGVCPECKRRLYPELYGDEAKSDSKSS